MTESSTLSRYRPAVLTIVGLAAGYGIYTLYTTFADSPSKTTALHRRNAIYRHRRDRQNSSRSRATGADRASLDEDPSLDYTSHEPRTLRENLAFLRLLPVTEVLQQDFSDLSMDSGHGLEILALKIVTTKCFFAEENDGFADRAIEFGLADFMAALQSRDPSQIQRWSQRLPRMLNLETVSDEQVELLLLRFLSALSGNPQAIRHRLEQGNFSRGSSRSSEEGDDSGVGAGMLLGDDDAGLAETEDLNLAETADPVPSQGLRSLLYYIAEDAAIRKAFEHRGIQCEECGQIPILGERWHCLHCPDFDLCSTCEAHTMHNKTHVLAKIIIPIPILSQPFGDFQSWYPGDPHLHRGPLEEPLKKALCHEHGFEEPQIDAFYDQFSCLANEAWSADPTLIGVAIDRSGFQKAMQSPKWPAPTAPNALRDRMFAFYDTDDDGRIGFVEFVEGLAYLRGPRRFASLHRAIKGFDFDEDGYVDRNDFLRLLRAKFKVHRQLIQDSIELQEYDQTQVATDTLRSSQPISSIFTQEDIPPGESRPRHGKTLHANGDLEPQSGVKSILDDDDETPGIMEPSSPRKGRDWTTFASDYPELSARMHRSFMESQPDEPLESAPHNLANAANTFNPLEQNNFMRILQSFDEDEPESRPPHNTLYERTLWQLSEDSLNEILDPLFLEREQEVREILSTVRERQHWRDEIAAAVGAQDAKLKDLAANADVEPLLSTALDSEKSEALDPDLPDLVEIAEDAPESPRPRPFAAPEMVPTDPESLARLEADIAQQPLAALLSATGYEDLRSESDTDDESKEHSQSSPTTSASPQNQPANTDSGPSATPPPSALLSLDEPNPIDSSEDSALPSGPPSANAANADPQLPTSSSSVPKPPSPPSNQPPSTSHAPPTNPPIPCPPTSRLLYLARLNEREAFLGQRRWPARLSYAELEAIALADRSLSVRALIKSWLEWASF